MTQDTIFDIASLTKVFTALSVIKLAEDGRIRLTGKVSSYLPEFSKCGKDSITIEQLLLHSSGLPAVNPLDDYSNNYESNLNKI